MDGNVVEELRSKHVEVERAVTVRSTVRVRRADGGQSFHAVDANACELRAQTANRNLAALAGVTLDRDARDALNGFREVQFRECSNIFRNDLVNRADRIALQVESCVQ